jgi:glycosyltransferase involved in cell wall biosynthesis
VKVAVVTQRFPTSQEKWAGHSGYQTLRVLAQRTDLHVFYPEATYPSFLTPPGGRRAPLDRNWNPDGVATTYIPYPVLPVVSRPLNGFVIAHKLLPYVRRFQPDIVLNYFIYPDGFAAVRIARTLGVPSVLTATGGDIHSIPNALVRGLTRSALRNADFVSVVSQQLCDDAIALGAHPDRSRPKLNGCDTTVFYPQDRAEARVALGLEPDAEIAVYVGRLDLRKGLIELIDAVSQLAPQRPNLRCYIVGDGPAKPALLEVIARHNSAAFIQIVPSCSTAQIAQWMAASNLVTLPSYNEGCPNVVVEALAAGRPLVATDVGGIPELMDFSCGRMVPPRDVPALARALNDVLNQSWNAETISSRHGRSWSNVADDLYQVLEETRANYAKR